MSRPPSRAPARRDSEYSAAVPSLDSGGGVSRIPVARTAGHRLPHHHGRVRREPLRLLSRLPREQLTLPPGAARGDVRFLTHLASRRPTRSTPVTAVLLRHGSHRSLTAGSDIERLSPTRSGILFAPGRQIRDHR